MWWSRGCLGPHAISDAWLCHVSIAGGLRRRGCAAAGVSVFLDGPLGEVGGEEGPDDFVGVEARGVVAGERGAGAGPAVVGAGELEVLDRAAGGAAVAQDGDPV